MYVLAAGRGRADGQPQAAIQGHPGHDFRVLLYPWMEKMSVALRGSFA